ncbi:choline/ethanolamine kinase family protein [Paludisphaera mucosa]|uniref:Phosphotransferase family protein n=1 Tax=Paludisphaera mucosa TaxID=3030827 RepID=A0ABT6FBV9_9BACT|nr:choline/ethanolamine kinase family protein [Paludisphaera mucosa]MDG3005027.1 phosphotransferase family protein [Paludisphaera mucosa]
MKTTTISIDQVIDRIPAWSGRSPAVTPLVGGLTNRAYRVAVGDEAFVVRIPGVGTEWLAIDRGNELHNSRAAAEAGVGPRVVHHFRDVDVLVLEFIPAETMTLASMRRPGMPVRLAHVLKRLHAGPRFLHDFDMFALTRRYLRIAQELEIPIPDDYVRYMPEVERIEAAFARRPVATVPCHNDLLAGNILDDGRRLRLIDFEYSGNNDPAFELGNACQELEYDEPRVEETCAAYFGEAYPDKLARMKLNILMSNVGWTLWAAIQWKVSTIDFDFWSWVDQRWGRARAALESPEYRQWLDVLEGSGPRPRSG